MTDRTDPHAEPGPTRDGLLKRWGQALRARFGTANNTTVDSANALPAPLQPHVDKLCGAAEAVALIERGQHVYVGTACATPRALVAALEARQPRLADVELLHFLTDHAFPHDAEGRATTQYRHRCFFVGADMRAAVRQGLADVVPVSIAAVPHLIGIGRIPIDVALIQVSLPDAFGFVSLGVSVDITPAAVARARIVIAEVNPAMPNTVGDTHLHLDQIDRLVLVDCPVIEYQHPAVPGPVIEQIARYISGIIDDGSTLQIGLGRITHEALKLLLDRRDLGIHSDVITDAIIPLLDNGNLTGRCKTHEPGRIVASLAMGSRRLYDLIDGNPRFDFQPIDAVCRPEVLAAQHKLVSVTQAFAIDLTGQVCVDQLDGDFYSGLAAQGEFLRAAAASPGGKAIVCLAATDARGETSCVRAVLKPGEGASIARSDVHFVITEYGIAYLFGKSVRERAVALIAVAHPRFRAELLEQAKALGYLPQDQLLKHLQAYAVEDESRLALKDGRTVLMRPAGAGDADGVRTLFHRLSERDVYTRFFRKLRGLSNQDVQRLCNLNHETEVAFVAVVGSRESPEVVAHSCYFVDPSTNLGETAFMIHPEWQGLGLGKSMQQHMAAHAAGRNVRGFVADVLATNAPMIRLAQTASAQVSTESEGSTVRVTALFGPA